MTTTNMKAKGRFTLLDNKTGKQEELSTAAAVYTTGCIIFTSAVIGLHLPGAIEKVTDKVKGKLADIKAKKVAANAATADATTVENNEVEG